MKTLTVDDHKRIRIPDARPRQKFAYENHGDGRITLTVVTVEVKDPFPPDHDFGLTAAQNKALLKLAQGSSLEVPE